MSPTKALAVLLSIAAVVAAYVTFGRLTSTVPTGSIATVPVVQVDFLRTRTNLESGAVDLIYRGVRYLADAADGRMRVDRTPVDNSQGPTSVLFLPTRRQPGFNPGRRIELNHSTKQATVSATQFYWPFPSTPGEPQPETAVEPDSEPLGVRYLGPLRLKGFRNFVGDMEAESWFLENSPKTQVIEERIKGERVMTQIAATGVQSRRIQESLFEVPAAYTIEEREPWLVH